MVNLHFSFMYAILFGYILYILILHIDFLDLLKKYIMTT